MKINNLVKISFISLLCLSMVGCASYRASSLMRIQPECTPIPVANQGIVISAKAFTHADCMRYLDRDIIRLGYQPIQITIQNNRSRPIIFTENAINLPIVSPDEIAPLVHTSTLGRVTAYCVGGIFLWPLFIPAVVDGIKSSEANDHLDRDFWSKSLKEQLINPSSYITGLVFIPMEYFQPNFSINLYDADTRAKITLDVVAR